MIIIVHQNDQPTPFERMRNRWHMTLTNMFDIFSWLIVIDSAKNNKACLL